MSFREKSTWVTFVLILLAFGIYFGEIGRKLMIHAHDGIHPPALFALLIVFVILVEIVAHVLMAARSPQDAKAAKDERDRFIALKSTRPAFFVLLVGASLSIGTMHLGASVWLLAHCVLLSIWIAELTRLGSQIYYYRAPV
jgi:hypothetical protein